jgi:hypothetical protein
MVHTIDSQMIGHGGSILILVPPEQVQCDAMLKAMTNGLGEGEFSGC